MHTAYGYGECQCALALASSSGPSQRALSHAYVQIYKFLGWGGHDRKFTLINSGGQYRAMGCCACFRAKRGEEHSGSYLSHRYVETFRDEADPSVQVIDPRGAFVKQLSSNPGARPSHAYDVSRTRPLQEFSVERHIWKPSTPAYSSARFDITSKASSIVWNGHGLKIHIPKNSLPPSLVPPSSHAQLKVDVHTLASELRYIGSPGYVPVSSLYSMRMGAGKLCKPVTIEFQHCLDISYAVHISDFVILRATDESEFFEPVLDAVFDRGTGYGKITVPRLHDSNLEYDDFSWFIVALRRIFLPRTIRYKAQVYTTKGTTKMYFIVTMALELCTTVCGLVIISMNINIINDCYQVVARQYPEESYGLHTSFPVEFDTRGRVSLDIPEDGKNLGGGLVITPFYDPSVRA